MNGGRSRRLASEGGQRAADLLAMLPCAKGGWAAAMGVERVSLAVVRCSASGRLQSEIGGGEDGGRSRVLPRRATKKTGATRSWIVA